MLKKEESENLYQIEGFSIPTAAADVDRLLKKGGIDEEDAKTYGFYDYLGKAKYILDQSSDFQKYLNVIHDKKPIDDIDINDEAYPSTLAILRDLQELIVPTPYRLKRDWYQYEEAEYQSENVKSVKRGSRLTFRGFVKPDNIGEEDPNTESNDEATVNSAFIVFLRSISKLVKDRRVHFVFDHVRMTAKFGLAKFTAITDGALQKLASNMNLAILEVKKRDRKKGKDLIQMQEGAEFVAWLKTCAIHQRYLNGYPFMLSQDREKLFVTFAIYDKSYLNYLKGRKAEITSTTYLTLQAYGPCSIFDKGAVEKFAVFILAITLAAQDSISA
ncbi:hypothetical protein DTO271D3_4583 [Paecilomyces variotii]|nr:hypothetical protein DTO271D3_4583 [Paecilomyces variotii]